MAKSVLMTDDGPGVFDSISQFDLDFGNFEGCAYTTPGYREI